MPGETLLSQAFEKTKAAITFTWCNATEWGLDIVIDGGRPVSAIFDVDSEDLDETDSVPKAVVTALMEQLKARERGIRNVAKLATDPLLIALADQLSKQEWTTGRRLRKLTGLDVDAFHRHLDGLMPRYVRREALDEDDKYSLTLPGLVVMDARLHSIAIMESVYQAVARGYDRDEEATVFENADIVACGVADADLPLARVIAQICLLVGGSIASNDTALRMPADREMIAAQVKKQVRFQDYLHHAATEKQRNVHFAVYRPWLKAPLVVERDALRIDYLPMGFHSMRVAVEPPATVDVPKVEEALVAAASPKAARAETLLPRLAVKYGEKLGDGAFGTVWEATDELLDRKLAVKFLTSTEEQLDEKALLRQARSLALVAHPNLVVVYGAAWLPHPKTGLVAPAIMMELLDGEPLQSWSAHQHDREAALRVATGLLKGIAAMHAAGLHHGDLHARNVIVLRDGNAKVIDWRYQDTFLARSTASREQLIESDARHAIDQVVSMFEKQGLREESLGLRRMTTITEAQEYVTRLSAPPALAIAARVAVEAVTTSFPPPASQLDREDVNEKETTEDHSELAIWPVNDSDLDASELMSEVDLLVRAGVTTAPIDMLFQNAALKLAGARRWARSYRAFDNVIQKWQLEIRDRGFLAFRWAKFTTHEHLLYETHDLLDAVVVPIHFYELATVSAARRVGAPPVARANVRLTVNATSRLVLQDDARVTTKSMYSPKGEEHFETQLEAQLPSAAGSTAARLINRLLAAFHVERDRFEDRGKVPSIVRLDDDAYGKYVTARGIGKITP